LGIRFLKTETQGPLFEAMRAKLAGIATHEGMVGIFKLRGADIYRVLEIEHLPGRELPPTEREQALLPALRRCCEHISRYESLADLVDNLLDGLDRYLGVRHSMLLIAEPGANKLYMLGSHGYSRSGIGAEIPIGVGVIGLAARECVPIRIMFAAAEYVYSSAVREQAIADGLADGLEASIPAPGLPQPASQLAVPILSNGMLLGVLYLESERECQFDYDLEDALVLLCAQVGESLRAIERDENLRHTRQATTGDQPRLQGKPLQVKYHSRDHSIFLDEEYLIKGVAGAVLWRLLESYTGDGRSEFSTRELRLDGRLPLPEVSDNLDARLLLLSRRLQERSRDVSVNRCGRGRIQLALKRPVKLVRLD
ncbi:MAG: GAF domain-containing protein, partial [Halioglobus sp.]